MGARALSCLTILALGLALAGCGDDEGGSASPDSGAGAGRQPAESPAGASAKAHDPSGVVLKAATSDYGRILFDGDDRAIYLFERDGQGPSRCYGACAEAWPPVLTKGRPRAATGVRPGLVGTERRDDGTLQATYAGRPLYYYVDDPPREVLCHGVAEFGGLWLVVTPGGDPAA